MKNLRDQSGTLYEIPLLFFAYGVICAILLPILAKIFTEKWVIVILMFIGMGVSFLVSLSISTEQRFNIIHIPACIWSYMLLSFLSVPFMIGIAEDKDVKEISVLITFILLVQAFLAFWLDYKLSVWWEKRHMKEPDLNA